MIEFSTYLYSTRFVWLQREWREAWGAIQDSHGASTPNGIIWDIFPKRCSTRVYVENVSSTGSNSELFETLPSATRSIFEIRKGTTALARHAHHTEVKEALKETWES